ncbi:WGR domain-containing protein [Mesorhizobium sp. ES1-4]|uniref:WGR domain-containing protein n=1 Tax=Mesorhizobium sp. ES1-4 TaxID=2876627 RepID=UPI001CD03410|nr:WGR domain-containing protein [Mesorhizobium sp. ES1-4]MBZ9798741.1 WGR domain-containing protein [Mesorhizobium sp. ES1-4]
MHNYETRPAYLRRIDAARNMARFYSLSIQPTLFGGASLIRNWGRIGTNGQIKVETFDEPQEIDDAFIRLERAKRRRGYVDPSVTGAD